MQSRSAVVLTAACAGLGALASAGAGAQEFALMRVATGLARPVFLIAPPGDGEGVFLVEAHSGNLRILDYGTADLWSLLWDGSDPGLFDGASYTDLSDHGADPDFAPDAGSIDAVASFGEDDAGNLYVLDLDGEVFLLAEPPGSWMQLVGVAALFGLARFRPMVR